MWALDYGDLKRDASCCGFQRVTGLVGAGAECGAFCQFTPLVGADYASPCSVSISVKERGDSFKWGFLFANRKIHKCLLNSSAISK